MAFAATNKGDDMIFEHIKSAETVVVLCCHGIYKALDFRQHFADSSWALLAYQKGDPQWYRAHMRRAVERVAADAKSVLIITGGQTRLEAGQVSEAGSYWRILESREWDGHPEVKQRATTEEFAADSFQNLLFSICRFREVVGRYPERVEVVTWAFKEERFNLHRAALRWPNDRFAFVGVGYPDALSLAKEGEGRVLEAFRVDPYGIGSTLAGKRADRNPLRRRHGYSASCAELKALLEYENNEPFSGKLPWAA